MKYLSLCLMALLLSIQSYGWGQKGHDVTAAVAEQHLTKKAAKHIAQVLDGHSLVYYANWMDNASHTPEYAYTSTWHYLNVDEGQTYETMPKNPNGDVVTALTDIIQKLKQGGLSHEEEQLQLKMLIHLVGDMHCPMHAGHLSDRGGNRHPVLVFGVQSNLHSAWDSKIPEAVHRWSFSEWVREIDRLKSRQIAEIQKGSLEDWMKETCRMTADIYNRTPAGTDISYDYVFQSGPIIEQQFLYGGLRLARLLNEIYK